MYTLKGFFAFPALYKNDYRQIHPFGEISNDALTYSRDSALYTDPACSGVLLRSFYCQTPQGDKVVLSDEDRQRLLDYGKTLLTQSQEGLYHENREHSGSIFKDVYVGAFRFLDFGEMVSDGTHWMPEWIQFQWKFEEKTIKIWLSNQSFLLQYDEYEYDLIPPVDNLNLFHVDHDTVINAINSKGISDLYGLIDQKRAEFPYTALEAAQYYWESPQPQEASILTNWSIIIYGRAGKDKDRIRHYIVNWILERSNYTREDWAAVLPELFAPTEFIILPFWHQYAIPNQTLRSGFLSPTMTLEDAKTLSETLTKGVGYEETALPRNTVFAVAPQRDLGFLVIGSDNNRDQKTNFRELYPDYVGFSSSAADFYRLSRQTQEWIEEFTALIFVAKSLGRYTTVPYGYSRIVRENVVYATRTIHDFSYLMVTEESAIEALGIDAPYVPELIDETEYCSVTARLIRDHLLYRNNPHNVTLSQLGLSALPSEPLLTLQTVSGISTVILEEIDPKHLTDISNPHQVTLAQIGLGDFDRSSTLLKISGANAQFINWISAATPI